MAIHVQIDPLERTATLRGVHSLCAGESSDVILSGVPDADTPTLSLRVYRDSTEADQVACSVRPDTEPTEEGLVTVEGRAALRRGILDLRSSAVSEWASEDAVASAAAEEARKSGSKEPEARAAASYRRPDSAWLVVADSSRVWAACAVPFVLRPFDDALSPDPEVPLPSYAERAEAAAEAAESAASDASAAAESAAAAAGRAEAATSGKADLVNGKVPASQLPSYVDDVLEVAELPASGESGKLYVVTGTNVVYRWSGSSFVEVSPSRDWSGELAAKRGLTDFSVGDGWILVKPDGSLAWLGRPDPQRYEWTGDGFTLVYETAEAYWGLAKADVADWVVDDSDDSPPDANRLEFLGSDDVSVYRLVRGSRLALDTEIPTVPAPVAPSTDPADEGKPADAKGTGDALAAKRAWTDLSFGDMHVGSWDLYIPPGSASPVRLTEAGDGRWTETGTASGEYLVRRQNDEGHLSLSAPGGVRGEAFGVAPDARSIVFLDEDYMETVVAEAKAVAASVTYADALALVSQLAGKYAKPSGGIPATDLSQAVQTALAAIPGKADAGDLRYALLTADVETQYAVPDAWFPITFTHGGAAYSVPLMDKDMIVVNDGYLEYHGPNGEFVSMAYFNGAVLNVIAFNVLSLAFNGVSPVEGETALDATTIATLADRAVNLIEGDDETSIDIELPEVQTGYSRDLYLAVTCGSTAPTLNAPNGVTLVNAKGEPPDLSLSADATTVLRFTEVKEADSTVSPATTAVFCVTGGANGGGSLDLSILAEEFSEQSAYGEGDIVQYRGGLYVCVLDIETPGPWDDADWSDASPVIPVLLGMIRGKADSSALAAKAESTALSPAWISGHAYFKGDHVSYNGLLYECLSTVAGSTVPSADTTHWGLTDLAAPDATLDILSDGRLRVVAADGTPMWTQGYALASESAVALSCEKINKYVFAATTATAFSDSSTYAVGDRVTYGGKVYKCSTAVETAGAWTAANWDEDPDTQAFALPNAPSGVVGDFVLDVDNTANEVPVMVAISGTLGTDYDLIVEKGRSSVDVLTIEGGALAELYFTMTAFGTAAKPAWRVVRLNVERQGVGS